MIYKFENPSFWIEFRSLVDQRFDNPIAKLQNQSSHCNTIVWRHAHRDANSVHSSVDKLIDVLLIKPTFPWFFDTLIMIRKTSSNEGITSAL